jgi:hypothetical protein
MFKVTRFCVQPYVRRKGRLVADEAAEHYTPEDALRSAARMRRRVAGVAVYAVTGWPVYDLWDEPRLISQAGETGPRP